MAKDNQAPVAEAQKVVQATPKSASKASILARRMKAVEEAGNMTPKMQRNFDRFSAKIN